MKAKHIAIVGVAFMFIAAWVTVLLYDGMPGSTHIGGLINIGLAAAFVHAVDLCDDRFSLYEEIVVQQNMAVAVAYASWIIGSAIAFPSIMY